MPRISPATYNIRIPQRATFEENLVLKANGTPLNLTGYSILASVWKDRDRREKIIDLTVSFSNRSQGSFSLSLTRTQTRSLSCGGFWDLLVINPSGDGDYWLEGSVDLDIGLTDSL